MCSGPRSRPPIEERPARRWAYERARDGGTYERARDGGRMSVNGAERPQGETAGVEVDVAVDAGPPLQRERARTIFQKGAPGRRAFQCPAPEVPAVDPEQLLPARFRRARAAGLPEVS